MEAGIQPHPVLELYCFYGRPDLEFAEHFYYIDQRPPRVSRVAQHIANNAVPL